MGSIVEVNNLTIHAIRAGCKVPIVNNVSFSVSPGKVLALIGESGSGKTTTALSLMAYTRDGCKIVNGSICIDGQDILTLGTQEKRMLRGGKVAYVAQSAAASFNPSRQIIDQVIESSLIHHRFDVKTAKKRAVDLFKELALPDPEHIGQRYPNQVSGGQLQRMMAAMALINDPDVVIFDEPTTALDVTTQIEVLRAFRAAIRDRHTTAIYVSHDLAVVAQMADDILVLKNGEMQEIGPTDQVIESPKDPYTAELLAARQPKLLDDRFATVQSQAVPLIQLSHVHAGYGKKNAAGEHEVSILHDISLKMYRGQSIGIIGESGSGKTTLAGVIAGLMSPSRGEIVFEGKSLPPKLVSRDQETLRKIQMVFQSADTALNPQMTIEQILARPLRFFLGLTGTPLHLRVQSLLSLVKLPSGVANRLPGELSGGQKQRVNLARALAAEPDLILCDEVTSALDTIVGAAILDLIVELRRELNLSVLFISHDLNTVRAVCDEIVVMQRGHIVTRVPRADYQAPAQHPYYKQLTDSVPELRRDWLDSL